MAAMESMLGENPAEVVAKAVTTPELLTDAELVVMDSWMMREIAQAQRIMQLAESGIYPSEAWENDRTVIDFAFASKFKRTWWGLSRNQYAESDPRLVELVDSVIAGLPKDDDWKDFLGKLRDAFNDG